MILFCFLVFIFLCYFISNSIICHNIIIHVSNDNGIWMYLKCAYEPLNDFLMTLISCTTHFLCKMRFMTTNLYTKHPRSMQKSAFYREAYTSKHVDARNEQNIESKNLTFYFHKLGVITHIFWYFFFKYALLLLHFFNLFEV